MSAFLKGRPGETRRDWIETLSTLAQEERRPPERRRLAVYALALLHVKGRPLAPDLFLRLLEDPEPLVRSVAAMAIQKLHTGVDRLRHGWKESREKLVRVLGSEPDARVRQRIERAIEAGGLE